MDIRNKVIEAITGSFPVDYIRLEEDDGVSGFVVSPKFEDMSSLDRQVLIDGALRGGSNPLTSEERREVLMIAGLTPAEYDTVGAKIKVLKLKEGPDGSLEVLLRGGHSDAEYVRGILTNQKGIRTTDPHQVPDAIGILMKFRASGTVSTPLTKVKAARILKKDRYVEVMPNA